MFGGAHIPYPVCWSWSLPVLEGPTDNLVAVASRMHVVQYGACESL
jgi:hypothetical protein